MMSCTIKGLSDKGMAFVRVEVGKLIIIRERWQRPLADETQCTINMYF